MINFIANNLYECSLLLVLWFCCLIKYEIMRLNRKEKNEDTL